MENRRLFYVLGALLPIRAALVICAIMVLTEQPVRANWLSNSIGKIINVGELRVVAEFRIVRFVGEIVKLGYTGRTDQNLMMSDLIHLPAVEFEAATNVFRFWANYRQGEMLRSIPVPVKPIIFIEYYRSIRFYHQMFWRRITAIFYDWMNLPTHHFLVFETVVYQSKTVRTDVGSVADYFVFPSDRSLPPGKASSGARGYDSQESQSSRDIGEAAGLLLFGLVAAAIGVWFCTIIAARRGLGIWLLGAALTLAGRVCLAPGTFRACAALSHPALAI
jgi:hypothetical protein